MSTAIRAIATAIVFMGSTEARAQPAPQPAPQSISGQASVVDGDTIEIHGARIRLHGIDAPESGQTCVVLGERYRCGQRAALALDGYLGSQTVRCEQTDTDRWKRIVARCFVRGTDLGKWMVESGWAVAFRRSFGSLLRPRKFESRARITWTFRGLRIA